MSNLNLLSRINQAFQRALALQHLVFTPTELFFISDPLLPQNSTKLQVLYAPSLTKKPQSQSSTTQNKIKNPFLPYDPSCFVVELSSTHVLLLNKFPIIENHVLVVPKAYVPQSEPLELIDFENLNPVLQAFGDFIAYYNCGRCTGASVEHRHIQVIPSSSSTPLSSFMSNHEGSVKLGFTFAWTNLQSLDPTTLFTTYQGLLHQILLKPFPHNCLITSKWMLIVPRSKASAYGISVNAMGYTGCVLVDTQPKLDWLQQHGLLKLLKEVGVPNSQF